MTVEATMAMEPLLPPPTAAMHGEADECGETMNGTFVMGSSPWDSLATLPIRPSTARARRRLACYSLLGLGLLLLASDHTSIHRYSNLMKRLRQLSHNCASSSDKVSLITAEEAAELMPPLVLPEDFMRVQSRSSESENAHYHEPSHIQLSRAFVARTEALKAQGTNEARNELWRKFLDNPLVVRESPEVCKNWAAPHWAMMNILSSSLLGAAGKEVGVTYSHDCHRFMSATAHGSATMTDDAETDPAAKIDFTTIQEAFPSEPDILWNGNKLSREDIVALCKGCLNGFDAAKENAQNKERVTHHCLLFPDMPQVVDPDKLLGMERAPCAPGSDGCDDQDDAVAKPTALEAVLPLVRNRIYHAAVDWAEKSGFPNYAPRSGVVLYIEGSSIAIPPVLYAQHLPPHDYVTSLHVIASPTCATSTMLPRSEPCRDYAERVTEYLGTLYPPETTDVKLSYAASTAAAVSRMVLSKTVISPPFTLACILPGLAKQSSKETIMFELDDAMYEEMRKEGGRNVSPTATWFSTAGGQDGNIKVVPVSEEELYSEGTFGGSGKLGGIGTEGDGGQDGTLVFSEGQASGMQLVQGHEVMQSVSSVWHKSEAQIFDKQNRRPIQTPQGRMVGPDTSELAAKQQQGAAGGGGGNDNKQSEGEGGGYDSLPSPDDFMENFDEDEGVSQVSGADSGNGAAALQTAGGGAPDLIPPSEDGDGNDGDGDRVVEGAGGGGSASQWMKSLTTNNEPGPERVQERPIDGLDAASFSLPGSMEEAENNLKVNRQDEQDNKFVGGGDRGSRFGGGNRRVRGGKEGWGELGKEERLKLIQEASLKPKS